MSKKPSASTEKKNNYAQYKAIITVKEARKLLGKNISDKLSDEEVGNLVGSMGFLANRLLETKTVPRND